jgi:hypothetical protein
MLIVEELSELKTKLAKVGEQLEGISSELADMSSKLPRNQLNPDEHLPHNSQLCKLSFQVVLKPFDVCLSSFCFCFHVSVTWRELIFI